MFLDYVALSQKGLKCNDYNQALGLELRLWRPVIDTVRMQEYNLGTPHTTCEQAIFCQPFQRRKPVGTKWIMQGERAPKVAKYLKHLWY